MADNITLNSGSGGDTLAADDIGGTKHQLVKVEYGAADSATQVSTSNPMPVQVHDGTTGVSVTAGGCLYSNLRNAAGTEMGTTSSPLQVQLGDGTDQATVDSSGNLNVVLAEGIADDAAFTPATSKVVPVGATFDDTTPDSVDEGDIGAIRMSANRNAYTTIRDAAGNERGANVNANSHLEVKVDEALPAGDNNIGNVDVASALPAGDNNIGNVDIATIAAGDNNIGNVDIATIAAGDNNIGNVDIVTLPDEGQQNMAGSISVAIASDQSAVSVAADSTHTDDAAFTPGTSKVAAIGATFDDTAPDSVDEGDVGAVRMSANRNVYTTIRDAAGNERGVNVNASNELTVEAAQSNHDDLQCNANLQINNSDVTTGNPVPISGTANHDAPVGSTPVSIAGEARTTTPTAVGDGDVVRIQCDDQGRVVNEPHAPRDLTTHNRIALTSTSETTLIAAGGAGVFHDLVFISMSNESGTEVRVDIADSTTGTNRLSMDLAADGGGAVIPFPVPLTQATANNNWTATLSAAVSTVYITAIAVKRL